MRRAHRAARIVVAAVGSGFAMLAVTGAARAQAQHDINATDWRQRDRTDHEVNGPQTRPNFLVEMRFGTYDPQVDSEFTNIAPAQRPYAKVFGPGDQFYFGLEVDWQVAHIPYIGSIGPGLGWGFTERTATSKFSACSNPSACPYAGQDSGEQTSLTIMPMHLSAVLRIDEPMHRWEIPIIPYVKLGVGMGFWTAGTTSGKTYSISPTGISWGTHFALGGMLSLNWIDQSAVARSREIGGARDFYAFGEWMNPVLNGFGSSKEMHVGSSSWVVGLAVDF